MEQDELRQNLGSNCNFADCGTIPSAPSNSNFVDVTPGADSVGTYPHGSVATYACEVGFVATGDATSTCLESEEWGPVALICDAGV